jgi:hypothetical protein
MEAVDWQIEIVRRIYNMYIICQYTHTHRHTHTHLLNARTCRRIHKLSLYLSLSCRRFGGCELSWKLLVLSSVVSQSLCTPSFLFLVDSSGVYYLLKRSL